MLAFCLPFKAGKFDTIIVCDRKRLYFRRLLYFWHVLLHCELKLQKLLFLYLTRSHLKEREREREREGMGSLQRSTLLTLSLSCYLGRVLCVCVYEDLKVRESVCVCYLLNEKERERERSHRVTKPFPLLFSGYVAILSLAPLFNVYNVFLLL